MLGEAATGGPALGISASLFPRAMSQAAVLTRTVDECREV